MSHVPRRQYTELKKAAIRTYLSRRRDANFTYSDEFTSLSFPMVDETRIKQVRVEHSCWTSITRPECVAYVCLNRSKHMKVEENGVQRKDSSGQLRGLEKNSANILIDHLQNVLNTFDRYIYMLLAR